MEIITGTTSFYIEKPTAVAMGKFDGVHVGHLRLLEEILAKKAEGLTTCVFTFDPPPAVLFGFSDGKELSTIAEKREYFEHMGIDILIEYPMTKETAAQPATEFVSEVLCGKMNMAFIAAGYDLSFGDKGAGNALLLEKMAPEYGFEIKTIDKVSIGGIEVSSTYIRGLIEEGNVEKAHEMLGKPYSVKGRVLHGNHLGSGLGFPTANIIPDETKLMPKYGVYLSKVILNGKEFYGVTNVGVKPTVDEKNRCNIETFILDFEGDVYGEEILVEFLKFRRPEQKFASFEELKSTIDADAAWAREMTESK